jgi:hypothetical protein
VTLGGSTAEHASLRNCGTQVKYLIEKIAMQTSRPVNSTSSVSLHIKFNSCNLSPCFTVERGQYKCGRNGEIFMTGDGFGKMKIFWKCMLAMDKAQCE